ncbi:unnamed protein product [Brassica rapa]|uniref:Uncharacterized protein n=2 Tax=Brassica TaxID=3705 RepID=A0A3P6AV32_BRACM|nr:unnamed protein product [Brassica napus]CAG7895917.1 unnamed protein product [Brassica rapa]VDC92779.1 unnamed protein product [Brassica rapa]
MHGVTMGRTDTSGGAMWVGGGSADPSWGEARVFASVSADGSVRIFDLRDKEHSTIKNRVEQAILEVHVDDYKVVILDIRLPTMPVAELERHRLMAIRVVLMV